MKKNIKNSFISLFVAFILCISCCGCTIIEEVLDLDPLEAGEKVFSACGLNIPLTSAFVETEMEGFDKVFQSRKACVVVLAETFEKYPQLAEYSFKDYVDLVIKANEEKTGLDLESVTEDGLTYFEYSYKNNLVNQTYKYFSVVVEFLDGYGLVQFYSTVGDYEKYRPYFMKWSKGITFCEEEKKEITFKEIKLSVPKSLVLIEDYTQDIQGYYQEFYRAAKKNLILTAEEFGKNGIQASWTLEKYGEIIKSSNKVIYMPVFEKKNDYLYTSFSADNQLAGVHYKYLLVIFKTSERFIMIQIGCPYDDFEKNKAEFFAMADSIKTMVEE